MTQDNSPKMSGALTGQENTTAHEPADDDDEEYGFHETVSS